MCRNDKKLLKYLLDLPLYDIVHDFTIDPEIQLNFDLLNDEYQTLMDKF